MQGAGIFRFFGVRMALLGVVLSIGLGCASAHAVTQIGMLNQPYPYLVIEQDLRMVLSEFGRNLGIETKVSQNVGGVVRGMRHVDSADAFLRSLADAHDLVWYMDRNTLFVSTRKENSTELLPAPSMKAEQRQALASEWSRQGAGINIVLDDRSPALVVTGPTSFRERIAAVVNSQRVTSSPGLALSHGRGEAEIMVYRGKAGRQRVMVSR